MVAWTVRKRRTIENWRWWVVLPLAVVVVLPLALVELFLEWTGRGLVSIGESLISASQFADRCRFSSWVGRIFKWVRRGEKRESDLPADADDHEPGHRA